LKTQPKPRRFELHYSGISVNGDISCTVKIIDADFPDDELFEGKVSIDNPTSRKAFAAKAEKRLGPDTAAEIESSLADKAAQVKKDAVIGDPIPLDARNAPPLPDDIFPGWLGEMITALSIANEVPPELPSMYALAVLGTVCQRRFSIRPEVGYFEPLNIWTVCAMESGNRKTAVTAPLTLPLLLWERGKAKSIGEEKAGAESRRKTLDARIGELRSKAKKEDDPIDFKKMQDEIAQLESQQIPIPTVPRLISQDVTPEHLGTMLADNDERLGLLSDEGGIFDGMAGRYSSIPNLDIFLQSHAGSHVRVDRGSRPSVILNHPALTIGLSPQPDVVAGLTKNKGFRGRGLLARFIFSIPASKLGYRHLEPHPVPDSVAAIYNEEVTALANVPASMNSDGVEIPRVLRLTDGAWRAWKAWQRDVEVMMREGGRLENLKDWGGKCPGATARIAGLLHCATYASCIETVLEVEQDTMERAIKLAKYLLEHAIVAFDLMGADESNDAARSIWKNIEAKQAAKFTMREAWMPIRSKFKQVADIEPGIVALIDHNLIFEPHQAESGKTGRPSRFFHVNPKIVEGWQ